MKIENIAEAKAAAVEIVDFLDRVEKLLGNLGNLAGSIPAPGKVAQSLNNGATTALIVRTPAPKLMPDRLFQILREAGAPLRPKQIAESYITRGWPAPPSGNVYSTLLNSANYFVKKGRITKSEGGYSLSGQS